MAPRGDAPLSQRAHPAGGDQERSSQRRGCVEEAKGAEPGAHHAPAGPGSGSPNPRRQVPGVFGTQPGRHQGRVCRRSACLPQSSICGSKEALCTPLKIQRG